MTLGGELKLNFMVKTSDLAEGTYTAKIRHGDKTVEEVFTKYNATYSFVPYAVAAKQMTDIITVEVFDESGNAVSNVYETSVRTYGMNMLANSAMTGKVKTLIVDMLNYGAEAQKHFKYNDQDLANALLSEAQKALATKEVSCINSQVKGANFYGTNLSLEDKIVLNLHFKNIKEGYTAEVSFTDYRGNVKTFEKALRAYAGSTKRVAVDELVLADAGSLVTVTVYTENGAVHGTVTDSIESYVARTGDNALNTAIMKFATSAKAYLK
jgi:hypothetical protein